nr:MAG TPA: hypothetical protein [Caudoviricetes sp.]
MCPFSGLVGVVPCCCFFPRCDFPFRLCLSDPSVKVCEKILRDGLK